MQKTKDGEVKMVTLMLFGDAEHCQKVSSRYCRRTMLERIVHSTIRHENRAVQKCTEITLIPSMSPAGHLHRSQVPHALSAASDMLPSAGAAAMSFA